MALSHCLVGHVLFDKEPGEGFQGGVRKRLVSESIFWTGRAGQARQASPTPVGTYHSTFSRLASPVRKKSTLPVFIPSFHPRSRGCSPRPEPCSRLFKKKCFVKSKCQSKR
jgi:hypothetical protein